MEKTKNNRIILSEEFVQKSVIKYLAKKGWNTNSHHAELWEHGVDIRVRNNRYGRYWLIEVKGDPGKNVKNSAGSRSSSFNSAIGQILTRMHCDRNQRYLDCYHGYKYGIAFSTYFRDMIIKKMPHYVLRILCLYIFFVDKKGNVEETNWRKLKSMQKNIKI